VKAVSVLEHVKSLLAEKDKRDEQRFQANTGAVNAALQAAEKAVQKAEAAAERRFEGVNEFREQLAEQARTFASSEKVDLIIERINRMEGNQNIQAGRSSGASMMVAYALSAIVALVAIFSFFLK
jgi:anaerobic ribonucleoside-triphosphate reductase